MKHKEPQLLKIGQIYIKSYDNLELVNKLVYQILNVKLYTESTRNGYRTYLIIPDDDQPESEMVRLGRERALNSFETEKEYVEYVNLIISVIIDSVNRAGNYLSNLHIKKFGITYQDHHDG